MQDRKILHRQSVAIEQDVFATVLPRVLHQLRQISRDVRDRCLARIDEPAMPGSAAEYLRAVIERIAHDVIRRLRVEPSPCLRGEMPAGGIQKT